MFGVWDSSGSHEDVRYKLLAYIVVRDALAFYVGIPEFFRSFERESLIELRVKHKRETTPDITEARLDRYRKLITKAVDRRIAELEADYDHCQQILFEDNHWLQVLNLEPEVIERLIDQAPEDALKSLAVVPNWRDSDEELRRPYQRMEYNAANPRFR